MECALIVIHLLQTKKVNSQNKRGGTMSMKYYKLFDLLTRKGMKKTDLINNKIISSPTLAKLSKGETVTTEVLSNICEALNCQPEDIMEYVPATNQNNQTIQSEGNK